jgi:hypothetical protein
MGVSVIVPLVACAPLHAPLAVQDAAFVDDQVSVVPEPTVISDGDSEMFTVGAGGGFTVRVAELLPAPPVPVQLRV